MAYLFKGQPIFVYPLSDLSFSTVELFDILFSFDTDRMPFTFVNTIFRRADIQSIGFFIEEPHKIVIRSVNNVFAYVRASNDEISYKYTIKKVNDEDEGGYQPVLDFWRLVRCTQYKMTDVIKAIKREHEPQSIQLIYFNVKRNLSTYHKKFEEHGLQITRRTTLRKFLKDNGAKWSRVSRMWYTDVSNPNRIVANIFCPNLP